MCKRRQAAILVVVAVCAIIASAPAATWTGPGVDWCDGGNWDDGVPGPSDTAIIGGSSPLRGPIVGGSCSASVLGILGPNPAEEDDIQVMDINTSGTVTVGTGGWFWEEPGLGTGIVNINGTTTVQINGVWRGSSEGISIINISGDPCIGVTGRMSGADHVGWFYINMSGAAGSNWRPTWHGETSAAVGLI